MIKHIVLWKIQENGTDIDRLETFKEFSNMIENLKKVIPEIIEAKVGYNIQPYNNFHICIDSVFKNRIDLEKYINHPEHLKVRDYLNQVQYEKTIFDYEF